MVGLKMKVKFAHVSDCHLGAWRKDTMNDIGFEAFTQMVDKIIEEEVNFLIIAGDLYDVSNPAVRVVDFATQQLKRLKDANIPVYGIMGSHDFSPSEKTMIYPLISADLFTNVSVPNYTDDPERPLRLEFIEDKKTNIRLCGMRARRKSLEIEDYKQLDRVFLEKEEGNKIFVLHTILNELKPLEYKDMVGGSKSILPRNFIYYAGGHIHKTVPEKIRKTPIMVRKDSKLENKTIYPGALYPTNFYELEQFRYGGFCIVSGEIPDGELQVEFIPLEIKEVEDLFIKADNKSAEVVNERIDERLSSGDFKDKIVAVRVAGELTSGKPTEIRPDIIRAKLQKKGAYEVFVNKMNLTSKEYSAVKIDSNLTNEQIESKLIHEHSQKSMIHNVSKEKVEKIIHELIKALGKDKNEGETVKDYDRRMLENFNSILNIEMEDLDQ
jgi:exonuclease SbcD